MTLDDLIDTVPWVLFALTIAYLGAQIVRAAFAV